LVIWGFFFSWFLTGFWWLGSIKVEEDVTPSHQLKDSPNPSVEKQAIVKSQDQPSLILSDKHCPIWGLEFNKIIFQLMWYYFNLII
jgi:hypothetical protein